MEREADTQRGHLSLERGYKVAGPSERPLQDIKCVCVGGDRDRRAQGEGKRQQRRRRTEAPQINNGRDSGTKKKTQSWSWRDTAFTSELWGLGRRWQVRMWRRDPAGLESCGVTKAPEAGKSLVSFHRLIGGGSLGMEAEVREGVDDTGTCGTGEQGWRGGLPWFQCPLPLLSPCLFPTHVSGAVWFSEQ